MNFGWPPFRSPTETFIPDQGRAVAGCITSIFLTRFSWNFKSTSPTSYSSLSRARPELHDDTPHGRTSVDNSRKPFLAFQVSVMTLWRRMVPFQSFQTMEASTARVYQFLYVRYLSNLVGYRCCLQSAICIMKRYTHTESSRVVRLPGHSETSK